MKFFKSFSKFHKVYFIFFLIVNIFFFVSPLFTGGSMHEALNLIAICGLLSSLTGLFAAIYTARAEAAAYAWGIANTCFYIFVSFSRHMYAEVILYTIYMLPMNIYGFYTWSKSARIAKEAGEQEGGSANIEVRSLKPKHWIGIIIAIIVVWYLYSRFVLHLPGILDSMFGITISPDKSYLIDSFTATVTICAVIISTQRFKETWYFWILADFVGIILYLHSLLADPIFSLGALSGALMWIQFTVNGVYGLLVWKKLDKSQHK